LAIVNDPVLAGGCYAPKPNDTALFLKIVMSNKVAAFHLFQSLLDGLPVDDVHHLTEYVGGRVNGVPQMAEHGVNFLAVTLARNGCGKQRHQR
jgi:hypothetical protein